MSYLHGKFVWFEHVSDCAADAQEFYAALFGWTHRAYPMGETTYTMFLNGQGENAGQGGYRAPIPDESSHWLGYVSVADVDATVEAAKKAGAKVLTPPTDYGQVGRGAVLIDPQGAVFAPYKSSGGDAPDVNPPAPGSWCWNELMTSDDQAALKFYESVLGYTRDSMPIPNGTYYILKTGSIGRAGLMKMADAPPAWTPYVAVADCDATHATAVKLGATSCVPPTDIPGVGRFAMFSDPVGPMTGILQMQNA